jgi:hypothetical protein
MSDVMLPIVLVVVMYVYFIGAMYFMEKRNDDKR